MKNQFFIIFLLLFSLAYSQATFRVKVVDSTTNKPISQAKVINGNEINFTNDDGNVLLSFGNQDIIISALSYKEQKVKASTSLVKLSPIYKDIKELQFRPIDVRALFEKVLKSYNKVYYVQPTLYKGTMRERTYINHELSSLFIADMDLWALNNKFNYKKDMDSFIQMSLNNVRYNRNRKDEPNYPFTRKGLQEKNNVRSNVSLFFLYNQLYIMVYTTKNFKIKGNIVSDNGIEQEINFKSDDLTKGVLRYEGRLLYNVKDNAITYLEVEQIQDKIIDNYKNNNDEDLKIQTTDCKITYDITKFDAQYIPSKINIEYIATINYKGKDYPLTQSVQYIFRTFSQTNKQGLANKIDWLKGLSNNKPANEMEENKTLLSSEEQSFIDEK